MVADAPEQWYTFKPMWPATQREAAELERRARATADRWRLAGKRPGEGRRADRGRARRADQAPLRLHQRLAARPAHRAPCGCSATCRIGPSTGSRTASGMVLSFVMHGRRERVRANLEHVCRWLDEVGMATPAVTAAARDGRSLDRLVRAAFGHWVLTYVEGAMAPRYGARGAARPGRGAGPRGLRGGRRAGGAGRGRDASTWRSTSGRWSSAGLYASRVGGARVAAPMETAREPARCAPGSSVRAGELGVDIVPLEDAAASLRERPAAGAAGGPRWPTG